MGGRYGGSGYRPGSYGPSPNSSTGQPAQAPGLSAGPAPTLTMERNPVTGTFELPPTGNLPAVVDVAGKMVPLAGGYGEIAKLVLALASKMGVDPFTAAMGYVHQDVSGYDINCTRENMPDADEYRMLPGFFQGTALCLGLGGVGQPVALSEVPDAMHTALEWIKTFPGVQSQVTGYIRKATGGPQPLTYIEVQQMERRRLAHQVAEELGIKYRTALDYVNKVLDLVPSGGIHDRRTPAEIAEDTEWMQSLQRPAGETQTGAEAFPIPAPVPFPKPRPDPAPSFQVYPEVEEIETPRRSRWRRGREKKVKRPWRYANLVGPVTEALDVLQCAWDALPKDKRSKVNHPRYFDGEKWVTKVMKDEKGIPITRPRPQQMAQDIADNWSSLDGQAFVVCVVKEAVEDYVLGKSSKKANKAFIKTTGKRPVGLGTGPAL